MDYCNTYFWAQSTFLSAVLNATKYIKARQMGNTININTKKISEKTIIVFYDAQWTNDFVYLIDHFKTNKWQTYQEQVAWEW